LPHEKKRLDHADILDDDHLFVHEIALLRREGCGKLRSGPEPKLRGKR
jgi:hypothetical protein